MNDYVYDPQGLAMTERAEALRLVGYPDQGSVPTIGYGHTGPDIYIGQVITQGQAQVWLQQDTTWAVATVKTALKVQVTQNQFDALVDFAFNVGAHAFINSHLVKLLNAGDIAGAEAEFDKWVFVKGVKNRGLQNRRDMEQAEFNKQESNLG